MSADVDDEPEGHTRDREAVFTQVQEIEDYEGEVVFAADRDDKKSGIAGEFLKIAKSFLDVPIQAKTIIKDRIEAKNKARVRAMPDFFPEVSEELDGVTDALDVMDEYQTSIEGQSREEISNVLRAGFGDDAGDVETGGGVAAFVKEDFNPHDDD